MKSLLRRYSLAALLLLPLAHASENTQEGSLNPYNGDGSTVNSNNNTEDRSVSNTYNGAGSSSEIPVSSAMAPSFMSNGMETCLKGVSGSVQTAVVGITSGKYKLDEDCNRRRDAKTLGDLGMKVAAIGRLCQSVDVWRAMFLSGTPCPMLQGGNLVVGKRAVLAMKMQPKVHIPDYEGNEEWYNQILSIGEENEEVAEDDRSVSDMFRTSK
jgi:hypothetical protein